MSDLRAMGATLRRWRENILAWFDENFPGVTLDRWQAEALDHSPQQV